MCSPSAMLTAPVSVAMSITFVAPLRQAYQTASASTSLPSASVLSTSMVLPLPARMISPGLTAEPDGIFSAQAIIPIRFTGSCNAATASIAPSTAAAPVISSFISPIPSDGLIEIPPLSKVMPLPTNAVKGLSPPLAYFSIIIRGSCTLPAPTARIAPIPRSCISLTHNTSTSNSYFLAVCTASAAKTSGVITFPGSLARSRAWQMAQQILVASLTIASAFSIAVKTVIEMFSSFPPSAQGPPLLTSAFLLELPVSSVSFLLLYLSNV